MSENQHLQAGRKHDQGKTQPDLILSDMSRAILAVAEVATFGAGKYAAGNWLHVDDAINRYSNAKQRHMLLGATEACDEESGLLHAAHEAWNALAVLELMLRGAQATPADWDAGENRMEAIGRNGNDGAHYPEVGFVDGQGTVEIGDHLPELGGYLIGFIGGHGVIMSKANWSVARYDEALEIASAFNSGTDARCCGFDDWRVPTKDQLNLAWVNRDKLAGLGMSNAFYWSSTEHSLDMAWLQHLSSGNQMKDFKGGSFSVRLVRSVPMDDLITAKEDGAAAEANDGERRQKIKTICPSWIT